MARTNYTYTPIYNKAITKPAKYPPQESYGRTYALEPRYDMEFEEERKGTSDTPVLALLFFVLPIVGVLAIIMKPMRWVLASVSLLTMFTMWGLRSFLPRGRAITSAILTVLAVAAITTALMKPTIGNGAPLGNANTATPPTTSATTNTLYQGAFEQPTAAPDNSSEGYSESDLVQSALAEEGGQEVSSPVISIVSLAEETLDKYLQQWNEGSAALMVDYTWPEWRATAVNGAEKALFFVVQTLQPVSWTFTTPRINDTDTSTTITTVVQMLNGTKETRQQYSVIMHKQDDKWYVDPNSFKNGIVLNEPTATPDPSATATPAPETKSTATSSTVLWYNSKGGLYYHAVKNCTSIAERYWSTMSSFKYGNINGTTYVKLKPCPICSAPARPK